MDSRSAAHVLAQIAAFLELAGENQYKSRAYQTAARSLLALGADDSAPLRGAAALLTLDEFHGHWRWHPAVRGLPVALRWNNLIDEARSVRAIVLGELHGYTIERAWQIKVLSEMFIARGANVVLVCERPVVDLQRPVILIAEQCGVDVRLVEAERDEHASVHERDVEARQRLRDMVVAEPEKTFVVCYGDSHRRSLQAALHDAGVRCVAVTLQAGGGLLADAIRVAGLRIQDYVFRYSDGTYFVPPGSYGAFLGCAELDAIANRQP